MQEETKRAVTGAGNAPQLHPAKTERGWELADQTGTFESLLTSPVYMTKRAAQAAADEANFVVHGFDELRAMEAMR